MTDHSPFPYCIFWEYNICTFEQTLLMNTPQIDQNNVSGILSISSIESMWLFVTCSAYYSNLHWARYVKQTDNSLIGDII